MSNPHLANTERLVDTLVDVLTGPNASEAKRVSVKAALMCIVHAARADTFREVTELALQKPDFPCVALALVTRMMGEEETEAFNLVGHAGLAAVQGTQN